MSKPSKGLSKRPGSPYWYINKTISGQRIRQSTGTTEINEAELVLANITRKIWQQQALGVKPSILFREAAVRFILEKEKQGLSKSSMYAYEYNLSQLDRYIGGLSLNQIHSGTPQLREFIKDLQENGLKARTINYAIASINGVLSSCAREWRHDDGTPWLQTAPLIKQLKQTDQRPPYPISWEEQRRLLMEMNKTCPHLANMILFKVNTGTREQEVCNLKWEWMKVIDGIRIFVVPSEIVKNRKDRIVVLNDIALSVVESQRGKSPEYVFTYEGHKLRNINTSAFVKAKTRANVPCRVHDMKHTYGARLEFKGVPYDIRQQLLGHKMQHITSHYAPAQIKSLWEGSQAVCDIERHNFTPLRAVKL